MKKLTFIIAISAGIWHFYSHEIQALWQKNKPATLSAIENKAKPKLKKSNTSAQKFRCDGRMHCSQMTSCEEAEFFLHNCPNTKMDGNHDGVPCERQWCGR